MGSKFISTSNGDLEAVSDGSLDIFGASLGSQNLTPGFPIKIDAERKLYSTALVIADVINLQTELDATIQTPYNGVIKASDFETDEYFSANDEFKRIENITNLGNRTTNIDGMLHATDMKTDTISDAGGNVFIQMDDTDINFSATNLTFNGQALGFGGEITQDLDLNNFDITGIGPEKTTLNTMDAQLKNIEEKIQYQSAYNDVTDFDGAIRTDILHLGESNEVGYLNGNIKVFGAGLELNSGTSFGNAGGWVDDFTPQTICSLGTAVKPFLDLNISGKINGLSPTGGLYSGISDSLKVSFNNSPCSILPLQGVGSLLISTFSPGDTYQVKIGGLLACAANQTLLINIFGNTMLLGSTGTILLSQSSGQTFNLDFVFTLRSETKLSINGEFQYIRSGGTTLEGSTFSNVISYNNINNQGDPWSIDVEASLSQNGNNSLLCQYFTLHKIF